MNIPIDPKLLLESIPNGLRSPLLSAFHELERNFRENRWEPSELNGGKLCEIVYTILRGYVDGRYAPNPSKPRNMVDACRNLEQADPSRFPRSVRIQIPRMLMALYEIRNNRGVGHAGGDVDPNHMDAVVIVYMAKWIMAELIRLFHDVSTESATAAVDSIVERHIPLVWAVGDVKRILNPKLTMMEKMLACVYASTGPVKESELVKWTEHSNLSVFRKSILMRAHRDRLIEYDSIRREVHISPRGIAWVEKNIDLTLLP